MLMSVKDSGDHTCTSFRCLNTVSLPHNQGSKIHESSFGLGISQRLSLSGYKP